MKEGGLEVVSSGRPPEPPLTDQPPPTPSTPPSPVIRCVPDAVSQLITSLNHECPNTNEQPNNHHHRPAQRNENKKKIKVLICLESFKTLDKVGRTNPLSRKCWVLYSSRFNFLPNIRFSFVTKKKKKNPLLKVKLIFSDRK